jgi:exopolysaccharide biosynthesis predicted pyruvyltransferase EpsI
MNSSYETVKAAFIKAAMQHHPDHSKSLNSNAEFVRIRQAFEEIISVVRSNNNNGTDNNTKHETWESDAEFNEWFTMQTGEYLTFEMNQQMRQEVIHVYRTMSSGGRDRGGHWEMARLLTEREDAFHRAGSVRNEQKSAASHEHKSTDTPLRRKHSR